VARTARPHSALCRPRRWGATPSDRSRAGPVAAKPPGVRGRPLPGRSQPTPAWRATGQTGPGRLPACPGGPRRRPRSHLPGPRATSTASGFRPRRMPGAQASPHRQVACGLSRRHIRPGRGPTWVGPPEARSSRATLHRRCWRPAMDRTVSWSSRCCKQLSSSWPRLLAWRLAALHPAVGDGHHNSSLASTRRLGTQLAVCAPSWTRSLVSLRSSVW